MTKPELSVVVIVHDMAREAPRTLHSLSASYQRDIPAGDYEVLVIDNGSSIPFNSSHSSNLIGDFRYLRLHPAPASPARAINLGISEARGDVIGLIIDGARMVTPGLLHLARHGARLFPRSIVGTLGWYLGDDYQSHAVQSGYDQQQEDALLDSIQWPMDGYQLFDISTPDESSVDAWFCGPSGDGRIFESNALFASRDTWQAMRGADERFESPGGGLLSFDLLRRALRLPESRLVLLLGEGAFHQLHGGIATNAPPGEFSQRYRRWAAEYAAIRGEAWSPAPLNHPPVLLGTPPRPEWARMVRAAIDPTRPWPREPVGPQFDLWSWPDTAIRPAGDATEERLQKLMKAEFSSGRYDAVVAIARLLRSYAPRNPEARRVLRNLTPYYDRRSSSQLNRGAYFHRALGNAHLALGNTLEAEREFHTAGVPTGVQAPC